MGEEQIRRAVIELERQQDPALPQLQRYRDILREQVRDYVEREYLLHAEGKNQQFMEDVLSKTRLSNIEHTYLQRGARTDPQNGAKTGRHAIRRKRRSYRRGQLNMAQHHAPVASPTMA